jgi:hypothetical protein
MMKANGLQRIRNVYGGYGAIKNDERVALTLPVTA